MSAVRVNLVQGSQEWIDWRKEGVGASDVASILGISPYISQNKLWKIKKNIIKDYQISEYAKMMGSLSEDEARTSFNELTGKVFEPACFYLDARPEFKCSLDGYCNGEIFEAKFIAEDYYNDLKKGKPVRPDHFAQLQWQMFIIGAPTASYFVITKSGRKMAVNVEFDDKLIVEIIKSVDKFMYYLNENIEPPLADSDYYEVDEEKDMELASAFNDLEVVKKQMDILKKREEDLRAFLIKNAKHSKVSYKSFKMFKSIRGGGLDYKAFCDKNGYQVPKEFEKKPSESWTIKLNEEV